VPLDDTIKRRNKIVRSLVRLKYSLQADQEIEEYLEAVKQGQIAGRDVKAEITLEDIVGEG